MTDPEKTATDVTPETMIAADEQRAGDPVDQKLVAYLDGEL